MALGNANLPPVYRWDFGDYTGLGSVFQKFLANLNLFSLAVYSLLNKGLTFSNMQRAIYSTTIVGGVGDMTTLSFVNPLNITPTSVSVVQILLVGNTNTALANPVSAANWFFDGRSINILNITGLNESSSYQISLEVA